MPALLLLATALMAAVPPAPARAKRYACIDSAHAENWRPVDDHTVIVTSFAKSYRVTTSTCPPLTRGLPHISAVVRGGTSICRAHDAGLYVSESGAAVALPCEVLGVEAMTPEEVRALDARPRR